MSGGDVGDNLVTEMGIYLMASGTFVTVVGVSLYRGKLEDLNPALHAVLKPHCGFGGVNVYFVKGGNIVGHFLVDLLIGGFREALALTPFVHEPHDTAPSAVGALEGISVGQ